MALTVGRRWWWALLACAPAALAADPGLVGSTDADFLKLGAGARAAALGEAVTADPIGLSDLAYNPAGLALGAADGVELSHTEWFQGARLEGLAARLGLGRWGGLGLSFGYLSLPSQQQTVATGNSSDPSDNFSVLGSFSPADTVTGLSYAYDLDGRLRLGATLKATSESLDGHSEEGLGADLGLLFTAPLAGGSAFTLGLAGLNEGATRYAGGDQVNWPQSTDVGLAYRSTGASGLRGAVMLDYDLPSDNQPALGLGAEIALGGVFTPRLGYRLDNVFNPWSVGVGVQAARDLHLDLAMVPAAGLGMTYRAALGYQWGVQQAPAAAAQAVTRLPAVLLKVQQAAFAPAEGLGMGRLRPLLPAGARCAAWGLYIYSGKSVVRTLQAKGQPPDEIDWDGKRDDGSPADPGVYPARLAVKLVGGGTVYSDGYVSFQVYQAFPKLTLRWDARSVLKASKAKLVPAILDVKAGSVDRNLAWRLTVLGPDGQAFRTFDGDLRPSAEVVWDGKADDGRDFYSNYHYEFKLDLMDKMGNRLEAEDSLKARMVFGR